MAEENQSPLAPYATPAANLEDEEQRRAATFQVIDALSGTRTPALICAIVGFMMTVLMVLLFVSTLNKTFMNVAGLIFSAFFALCSFFTSLQLTKYSRKISKSIRDQELSTALDAISSQRIYWVYMSIIACIVGLFLLFAIIGALNTIANY